MADLSAECLIKTIDVMESGSFPLAKQDEGKVTFAYKLNKKSGLIGWNKKASDIHNLVRGLLPWPSAYTHCSDKMVKVLETCVVGNDAGECKPGEVMSVSEDGILVATGRGGILVQTVHPESSKKMDAKSFAVGHDVSVGFIFL